MAKLKFRDHLKQIVTVNRKPLTPLACSLCFTSAIIAISVLACALPVAAQDWRVVRRAAATGANRDFNTVHFANDEHGWVAGDRGVIFQTRDGGTTWTPQSSGVTGDINDIYFRNEEDGFFLVGNRIFATTTGGAVWRERAIFAPGDFDGATPELYSITFANNRRGWIVGSVVRREQVVDSLILSTSDGGQTWRRQTAPIREELIDLDFAGDERGWVVGSRGTILHTRDGGRSWVRQESRTTNHLYALAVEGRDFWAVGGGGIVLQYER